MNIKVDFDNIVVKEDKNDFNVKVLMLKGEKGDSEGEANVIETVQVNGTALPVTNKTVNVPVPIVDSAISSSSTNPVQNSAIYNALSNKADTSALDNYYQISEIDGLLEDKANASDLDNYYTKTQTYSKSEADTLLEDKADTSEIDTINSTLLTKANTSDVADTYETKASHEASISTLTSQISSLASGSPLVASSTSGMTDTTRIYVNTTDGHWYYYDGSAWADGGVYQATEDSNTVDELAQDVNDLYINLFPLKNYLDYSNYEAGKYYKNNSVGTAIQIGSASGYAIVPPIKVKKNVTYQFANIPSVGTAFSKICDKDGIVLEAYPGQAGSKFTPNYDGYAYITFTTSTPANYPYAMLYLDGYAPSGYVEYGKFYNLLMLNTNYIEMYNFYDSIKNLDFDKKHTTITVGNDKDYTTITSAIASISDASSSKIYDVMIDDGTYNEYSISLPDYVNLIGVSGNKDDCIIRGYLDPSVSDNGHRSISTIDLNSNNVLKDLTITAQNMRYPIHHESSGAVTDWETIVENCHIEHFGNQEIIDYRIEHNLDPGNVWSSPHAWGEGASSGAKLTIKDTTLKSVEIAFYVHAASSMSKPYYHELINCKLITSHANQIAVYIDNNSSPLDNNTLIIKDCYIGGRIANIDNTTIYNCMVSGSGIKPVYQRPGHVCEEYDFPLFTDYVDEYVAGESISKGTFVYTTDGKTIYKANSTTNKKLIVGYVIGNKSTGDLTKVMKGYLQPSSQTWPETPMTSNKYYTINNNGLLEETNDLDSAIAISNNYAYKLFI